MAPSPADLTAAADQFWRDGACVVRGAVDTATVARIAAAVDRLGERELADLSAMAGDTSAGRFRGGVDHWRTDPDFAAFATTGPIPTVTAAVLGTSQLWLYEDSVLVKDPGSPVPTRWHTDDGYFHVEGGQMATVWLALDPSPRSAGALRFLAGSHVSPTRYRPTLFVIDDPIPGTEGEAPPALGLDDPGVFGWDLEPGDITIHHARTLHAAGGNEGTRPRRALSIRYCGDDAVVRVKPGAPGKPGFDAVAPGTPLGEVAGALGLPAAELSPA